jgi:general secretion pathway protein G
MKQRRRINGSTDQRNNEGTRGITLIEMLVVISIIALFSAIAFQRLTPALDEGRRTAARTQIEAFNAALQRFNIEHSRFPSEEEGLQTLRPFLTKDIPNDPWDRPYIYRFPGEHGPEPDVMSYGADGQPGGEESNEDIVSWR